jgi:hypothetical protein
MERDRPRNIREAMFWKKLPANMHIYERIDQKAFWLIGQGRTCYAIDAFFNELRWNTGVRMSDEEWKMSDRYRPYFARYWTQEHPLYWWFFELRRCEGEYPFYLPPTWNGDDQGTLWTP